MTEDLLQPPIPVRVVSKQNARAHCEQIQLSDEGNVMWICRLDQDGSRCEISSDDIIIQT